MTASAPSDPQPLPHLVNDYKDHDAAAKDRPTVELTVVVPAYNESNRIESMLRSAVEFLETRPLPALDDHHSPALPAVGSYEILIVDDGSKDHTSEKALEIAGQLADEIGNKRGQIKVCRLVRNRGKGGATKHVRPPKTPRVCLRESFRPRADVRDDVGVTGRAARFGISDPLRRRRRRHPL